MAIREDEKTIAFLRMAATQLREIAAGEPLIARKLHHISSQLEAEAAVIEGARMKLGRRLD
jgi:hypothetical protein